MNYGFGDSWWCEGAAHTRICSLGDLGRLHLQPVGLRGRRRFNDLGRHDDLLLDYDEAGVVVVLVAVVGAGGDRNELALGKSIQTL